MAGKGPSPVALLRTLGSLWSPDSFETVPPTTTLSYDTELHGPVRRGRAPLGDVVVPREPTGRSAVLVHGGGFLIGSRRMKPMRFLAARLAAVGVTTFAVDYRMPFRGGRLEEGVEDVLAATRLWSRRAADFGADPAHTTLIGLSAGGALATLAAADAPVSRLIGVFGLYDFSHLGGPVASVIPRLASGSGDRAVWSAASPLRRPLARMPMLVLHGTSDGLVPYAQAQALVAARAAAGLPTELETVADAPHAFFNAPGPFAEQGLAAITRFITRAE